MKKILIFVACFSTLGVFAQTNTNQSDVTESSSRIDVLESLYSSLSAKQEELARLEAQLREASNETTKKATSDQLQSSAAEFLELKGKFEESIAGVDQTLFVEKPEEAFSWEENLGDIVKPIVSEIKSATAESRKISELRRAKAEYAVQTEAAHKAIERIESTLAADELPVSLREAVQEQLTIWKQREDIARNQADAAELQLKEILSKQKSLMENSKEFFRGFMNSRGQSLLLGALAFFIVFLGIRFAFSAWQKRMQTTKNLSLNDRIINLGARASAVLFGMVALVVVFNLRSDWFLLSIVLIFLIGLAWVSIKALPHYIEAVRFVLNIGPVREGEILEFHGVLWRVENIGFKTYLENERLEGGWLRVPYQNLLDQLSRPKGESELLFPTKKGDWILLNDSLAEVVVQTPSQVIVRYEGGARASLPVADFVSAAPVNLSEGFRHEAVFGLDYSLQPHAAAAIPNAMKQALEKGLADIIPSETLKGVSVHFAQAAASSLDFEIEIDLDGAAAGHYQKISFAVQRILVELCTEKSWEIPFPQLAVTRKS